MIESESFRGLYIKEKGVVTESNVCYIPYKCPTNSFLYNPVIYHSMDLSKTLTHAKILHHLCKLPPSMLVQFSAMPTILGP